MTTTPNTRKAEGPSFLSFMAMEVWPIKGKAHILGFLDLMGKIPTNPSLGGWFVPLAIMLVLCCLQSVVHYFVAHPLIDLLICDYESINNSPPILAFTKLMLTVVGGLLYYDLYFCVGKLKYFASYKQILSHNNRALVVGSRFDFWKLLLRTLRHYQGSMVMIELWLVSVYLQFSFVLLQHPFASVYHHVVAFLAMTVSFIIFTGSSLLCCAGSTACCTSVFLLSILFERIKMIREKCLRPTVDKYTSLRLMVYRRLNAETINILADINAWFGPFLLCILALLTPTNCIMVAVVFFHPNIAVYVKFAAAVVAVSELSVFLIFHLLGALVTKRIHRPYKQIQSQYVHYTPRSIGNHLRVAHNIQAFMAKPYGMTYKWHRLNFGLVSLSAFGKFLLLYRYVCVCVYVTPCPN